MEIELIMYAFTVIGMITVWIIGGILSAMIPGFIASKLVAKYKTLSDGYLYGRAGLILYVVGTFTFLVVT